MSKNQLLNKLTRHRVIILKALSLAPSDTQFKTEKTNLKKLIDMLLVQKYRSIAKSKINSKDGSVNSVNLAIQYYQKAIEISREKRALQNDLASAQIYRKALERFNALDWDYAIKYLEDLAYFNQNYANGMVKKLLYEAYSARGRKYYTVGYYPDARSNFEAAEIMAWKDNANLLQIFEVQMALALTFGKMHNYSTADAYFEAALKSIDASKRITDKGILDALSSAHKNYINGDSYEAYSTYEKALADQTIFQKYKQASFNKGDQSGLYCQCLQFHNRVHAYKKRYRKYR